MPLAGLDALARGAHALELLARGVAQRGEIAVGEHALGGAAPEPRQRGRVARGALQHDERATAAAQPRDDLLRLRAERLVDHDQVEVRALRAVDAFGQARDRLDRDRHLGGHADREHAERHRRRQHARAQIQLGHEDARTGAGT
jgi:hypothetical protein